MTSRMDEPEGLGSAAGLRAFLGGIGFVVGTPRVWPYAAVPVAMMFVVTAGLFALALWPLLDAREALAGARTEDWARAGTWVVTVLLGALVLAAAAFVGLCLAQPLSGFALEGIASAQERALTGRPAPAPSFLGSLLRSMRIALVTLTIGATLLSSLFLVGFLFPPALTVTVPLKFLVGAWLLAWDFLDYPLGLHGLGLRRRLRWVRRNRGAVTAFGIAWVLLLVVPGVVLLILPMGVAGATRLVVEAERES